MKWSTQTERTKKRFLFFPKSLPNSLLQNLETRWLCFARYKQVKVGGKRWMDYCWEKDEQTFQNVLKMF